jgi:hypothetical protein
LLYGDRLSAEELEILGQVLAEYKSNEFLEFGY